MSGNLRFTRGHARRQYTLQYTASSQHTRASLGAPFALPPARPTHRVGSTSVARSTLSERILVAAAETDVQLQDPACATCASDSTVQYQH